jgi:hypothetical protein
MTSGTLRLAFYCTALFVSGMAVGALSHRYYVQDVVAAKAPAKRTAEQYRQAYLAEMKARLKLDAEQAAKLEVILDDTGAKFRALREQQRPHVDALQAEQTARVNALLNPEQQVEYEKMRMEREAKRKADDAKRHAEEAAAKAKRSQAAPSTE